MTAHTRASYTPVAMLLHWLIALLILINFVIGLTLDQALEFISRDQVLFYHASIGSLVFMLAVLRLIWRLTHRPPALPASVSPWQARAAHTAHWTLYILMLVVPLTGYIHRLAGGHLVSFFGIATLPVLIGKDLPLRLLSHTLHTSLVWLLAGVVFVHLAAVIKHQLIDRDGLLARMLPFKG